MIDIQLISGFFDGLRPEPILSVSEWSDKYRYLSSTVSAQPGLYRTERTPYLQEIMDKLSSHDPAQRIVFMKAAQVGATEAGCNWLGYMIDVSPCPILAVMPTDETLKRNVKIRIDPMIESSPRLREKVSPSRSRDSQNTINQKSFPGGVLALTGANSAVGLRSMPARALFLDDVDGYPSDLDGEGSPIELAVARTRTFPRRKIFIVSTPTIESLSAIEREFLLTDQRYYFVPCIHCEHMQTLKFQNLRWETGKPEMVQYFCEECGAAIEERFKTKMLADGQWRSTAPENASPIVFGYHINSLYSPYGMFSWPEIAAEWDNAQGDTNKLRVFVNTILGETWRDKGEAPEWQRIYDKREQYEVGKAPKEVAFITIGVDVQKDRLELEVVGWAKGKRSYSIDYRTLIGDTSKPEVWEDLRLVIGENWEREDGQLLPMRMMAIDTGYNTSSVYDFCRKQEASRVIPIKGQDHQSVIVAPPKVVDVSRKGKKIGNVKVWHVGVSILKSELYGWLRLDKAEDGTEPPGYCHFPQYAPEYFKGLTGEQLEFKIVRGYRKYQWVKKYERNEPLDCRVYARAAASVVGIDRFEDEHYERLAMYVPKAAGEKKKKRKRDGGSFWDR